MQQHFPTIMNVHEPKTLSSLRAALSSLYGLDKGQKENSSRLIDAHSFLIRFQGQNVRRKIQSLNQSERDSTSQDNQIEAFQGKIMECLGDSCGSTFHVCVAILARPALCNEAERLFCAQTLLSRIRRMPTYQAVDLEFEYDTNSFILTHAFTRDYWKHYLYQYTSILSSYHPALGASLSKYLEGMDATALITNNWVGEERLKCDISLIVVACLIFIQIDWDRSQLKTTTELGCNPIILTLSSAMALFALRLRCITVYSTANGLDGSNYNIIKIVVDVLDHNRTYFDMNPAHFAICVCSSLAAIPDAIFGSPGGARGRLSIDPKFIKTCYSELNNRSQGVDLVESTFRALSTISSSWTQCTDLILIVDYHLLLVCERWAKFLTLPFNFVETTVPLVEKYANINIDPFALPVQRIAFSYLIRLFEGASMDVEDVQAMYLGLSPDQLDTQDQDGKKRQSSRSKRRLKERVESASSQVDCDHLLAFVDKEIFERGEVACLSSVLLWSGIFQSVDAGLDHIINDDLIDGEGAIGCLISCISACVPHIIKFSFEHKFPSIFQNLLWSAGKISHSSSRDIRSFSIEILIRIYSALALRTSTVAGVDSLNDFDKSVATFLCNCSLQLARQCAYPSNYFINMTEESDEELEIERNDVRDVFRSICNIENTGGKPIIISLLILEKVLNLCHERLDDTAIENAEPIIHILSSLAKPVNWIAINLLPSDNALAQTSLTLTIHCLHKVFVGLLGIFSSSLSTPTVFPSIRLASLAIASFSPSFHGIGMFLSKEVENDEYRLFYEMLGLSVSFAIVSLQRVPELFGDNSQALISHLNIKGAMRAPGGEDHVSCIALMRLSTESDHLAVQWLNAAAYVQRVTINDVLLGLVKTHDELKECELQRGPAIDYGRGVTPKTRRILLNTIARLLFGPLKNASMIDSARSRLHDTFLSNYEHVIHIYDRNDALTVEKMFYICERTFDLASFPPELINFSLTSDTSVCCPGFSIIISLCLSGYSLKSERKGGFLDLKVQWSRLRAAVFTLLNECIKSPSIPKIVVDSLISLNIAECDAINVILLHDNPGQSPAMLLLENNTEDTIVPTGAFVRVLVDYYENMSKTLDGNSSTVDEVLESILSSLRVLASIGHSVRVCLCSPQPETINYVDPRLTLAESWFHVLSSLIILIRKISVNINYFEGLQELIIDFVVLVLQIIFYHAVEETSNKKTSQGMSVDGPHTFAMIHFLQNGFHVFGINIFASIHRQLKELLPLETENFQLPLNEHHLGGFIVCASMFRAFSGSLPPYIIENAPELYLALFYACERNMDFFHFIMVGGTQVKLASHSSMFHTLKKGDKLAGHIVQTNLIQQLRSILKSDSDWRLLKGHIKSACGGKKKATNFANKPTVTMWQFDRV